jgi:hypothetical protein
MTSIYHNAVNLNAIYQEIPNVLWFSFSQLQKRLEGVFFAHKESLKIPKDYEIYAEDPDEILNQIVNLMHNWYEIVQENHTHGSFHDNKTIRIFTIAEQFKRKVKNEGKSTIPRNINTKDPEAILNQIINLMDN